MEATLDKLIKAYIAPFLDSHKSHGDSEDVCKEAEAALIDKLRNKVKTEIVNEMTEEEVSRQKELIDKRVGAYSASKAIKEIKQFIIEGIILAVAIGLLVNQLTDVITYLKGANAYVATGVIIALLILIVFVYVLIRLTSTISKIVNSKDE